MTMRVYNLRKLQVKGVCPIQRLFSLDPHRMFTTKKLEKASLNGESLEKSRHCSEKKIIHIICIFLAYGQKVLIFRENKNTYYCFRTKEDNRKNNLYLWVGKGHHIEHMPLEIPNHYERVRFIGKVPHRRLRTLLSLRLNHDNKEPLCPTPSNWKALRNKQQHFTSKRGARAWRKPSLSHRHKKVA